MSPRPSPRPTPLPVFGEGPGVGFASHPEDQGGVLSDAQQGPGVGFASHQEAQGVGFYDDPDRPWCANPACPNQVMMGVSGRYLKYCGRDACRKAAHYHRRLSAHARALSQDIPRQSQDNALADALQAQAQALTDLAAVLASLRANGLQVSNLDTSDSPSLYSGRGPGGEALSDSDLLATMTATPAATPDRDPAYYGWRLNWQLWLVAENNNLDACLLKYGDEAIQWGIRVGALPPNAFDRQAELLSPSPSLYSGRGPGGGVLSDQQQNQGGSGNAKAIEKAPETLPPPEELDLDLL